MRRLGLLGTLTLGLAGLVSCAVVSVVEVEGINSTMSQALSQVDAQVTKTQTDYEGKNQIWQEVQKKPPAGKEQVLAVGTQNLAAMGNFLSELRQHQTKLHALQTEFQQAVGKATQISESDSRWPSTKLVRDTFADTTQTFNSTLQKYTDQSNQLSRSMSDHKLFAQIKPTDLVLKLNGTITQIQTVDQKIAKDLDAKELKYKEFRSRLGAQQPARERALFLLIEEMSELRNQLQLKIRRIEQMRDDFAKQNRDRQFIRSFEPAWEQVEQIRTDHSLIQQDVEELDQQFNKKSQVFATSLKEGFEESAE